MDSLDKSYSKSVLVLLYSRGGNAKKSDLKEIATNWRTITDVLNILQKDGYLTISEEILGRRTYMITLTPKGRAVAEQLKRAEEAASGVVIHEEEGWA